jgi:hypothetical protein
MSIKIYFNQFLSSEIFSNFACELMIRPQLITKPQNMLQRIQSLYMVIAVVASAMLFFFPVAKYNHDVQGTYVLFVSGLKYMIEPPIIVNFWLTFPMLLFTVLSILLTIVAIFIFKKRMIQLWMVNISFLLNITLIILVFLYYTSHFEKQLNTLASYQFGIFLPIVSLICLVMASRAIRKDEALVRSSDRLR